MSKPLKQMLIEAGYPESDMAHHETDLYVFDTPLTREVVRTYCILNGWTKLAKVLDKRVIKEFVINTFTDNITGKPMLDLAYQYYEPIKDQTEKAIEAIAHEVIKEHDWTMPRYSRIDYDGDYGGYENDCYDIGHEYRSDIFEVVCERYRKQTGSDIPEAYKEYADEAVWNMITDAIALNMDEKE